MQCYAGYSFLHRLHLVPSPVVALHARLQEMDLESASADELNYLTRLIPVATPNLRRLSLKCCGPLFRGVALGHLSQLRGLETLRLVFLDPEGLVSHSRDLPSLEGWTNIDCLRTFELGATRMKKRENLLANWEFNDLQPSTSVSFFVLSSGRQA